MKATRLTTTAMMLLIIGGATTAHAQDRGRGRGDDKHQAPPVPQAEQQRRVQEEQQRNAGYKQKLDHQVQTIEQRNTELEQQKRASQVRAQQQYAAELRAQQQRLQTQRDFARDPYVSTPHTYRYTIGGRARQTNQYGVDMLHQAVNDGYQQGYRAGVADRSDRWHSDYKSSPAYQDGTYGYTGSYVDESDYTYYFRQGFQRGYQDGFSNHLQYGSQVNGTAAILAGVATTILGLATIH